MLGVPEVPGNVSAMLDAGQENVIGRGRKHTVC